MSKSKQINIQDSYSPAYLILSFSLKSQGKLSWIFGDFCSLFLAMLFLPITFTSLFINLNTPLEAMFDPQPIPPVPLEDSIGLSVGSIKSDTYNNLIKIRAVPDLNRFRDVFYEAYRVSSTMMYSRRPSSATIPLVFFIGFVGVIFGGIHCFAWNGEFPSFVEKVLWRTSSLTVVGMSLLFCVGSSIFALNRPGFARITYFLIKFGSFVIPLLYSLSRLSLLVQAIVSLRNLPPSAFDTVEWTRFIPHI